MSLHWYACISTNTYCFETHHILLEMDWWALPNTSSIMWIHSAVHEILADKAFTATNGLISQSFVVAFVQIAFIWGFPAQLSLWKSVHWLWRYKLNEVCDSCNHPGILSSMVEILLFNSVFHDGVTPISISTLKPPLRVIGVLPLKSQASPILSVYI